MSRALRAACGSIQTPRSYTDAEGASLMLELHENERECEYANSVSLSEQRWLPSCQFVWHIILVNRAESFKLVHWIRHNWQSLWTNHTARAPNLRHDYITAKFSSVIPKQSDWSIMIS